MKRNLWIGAVLLAVLLLFAGCDNLLEAFYPDIADKAYGTGYEINLNVSIDFSLMAVSPIHPIRALVLPYYGLQSNAAVLDTSPNQMKSATFEDNFFNFAWTFTGLNRNDYTVVVWQDLDNDGKLGYTGSSWEPSAIATATGATPPSSVDFRVQNAAQFADVSATLTSNSLADVRVITALQRAGH